MSSLGIFQNGNGSIFWNFFNSWRSFVAEEMTSYLVVTSHVTPNDPIQHCWIEYQLTQSESPSEGAEVKYLLKNIEIKLSKFFQNFYMP